MPKHVKHIPFKIKILTMKQHIEPPRQMIETSDGDEQLAIAKNFLVHEAGWIVPVLDFPYTPEAILYTGQKTSILRDKYHQKDINKVDSFYNLMIKKDFLKLVRVRDEDNKTLLHSLDFLPNAVFSIFIDEINLLTPDEFNLLEILDIQNLISEHAN
jgi:hypothetical protein